MVYAHYSSKTPLDGMKYCHGEVKLTVQKAFH